jgi:NADP-dependent 3-hydroxy acid dehydrogenase YdfG
VRAVTSNRARMEYGTVGSLGSFAVGEASPSVSYVPGPTREYGGMAQRDSSVGRGRRTAVVTGASRGIGRAIAKRLSRDFHIVAAARTGEALDSLASDIAAARGACTPLVLDLRDGAAVEKALGAIDVEVLVNNAGVMTKKPFLDLSPAEWHQMVDVNLNALYHATRAVLPGMAARGSGHVVIIGSIAGRSAFVGGSCYAATKHAVMGFSESLLLEVRNSGVKVSVVMPGSVATEMVGSDADATWMLRPDDVAEAVAQVVSTPPAVLVHRLEIRALKPQKG